ncbi:ABC transporter ATP-binding protein [Fictibacillus sp. 7GRE50]|uniref:ABC transporter ATP-binding protein n=1 Tax=unclassified Fictibacillus TaxID=2644029 RepID=UPI0018CC9B1C|nr:MULTISPECIES: ABC transporter ATP-binding protein [unclassified Fictibacillus]MBH0166887.1 ABC transporter ATP-binding protein [Fictibacillus sp. 7GRE50]MBH0173491.1 ABC transporter ATP-binding protein [Fictibacillus sp. 23RED33]
MEKILQVNNLTTHYHTDKGTVKAVEGVNFSVGKGELLGLIGESGCGKSTVANSLLRLIEQPGEIVNGEAFLDGKELLKATDSDLQKVRWKEISVIPQSAMNALNPVFKVGDQIAEAILLHENVSKKEALHRAKKLLNLVGIEEQRWQSYPHEFSGGMKQRVAIAMALSCNPKLVISDESTTGLDVLTQAQIIALLKKLQKQMNLSVLIISHDLPMVTSICDQIIIMYAGKIVEWCSNRSLLENVLHPYTQGLIKATPSLLNGDKEIETVAGNVPNLIEPPTGCRFHPRCEFSMDKCKSHVPPLSEVKPGHYTACFLYDGEKHEQ